VKLSISANLVTVRQAADRLGVSVSFLNKARLTGSGPGFVKLGRAVRYRIADLEAFILAGCRSSTSNY
jgi:hypothetical protein